MSIKKKKIISVLLSANDLLPIEKLLKETGVVESTILRGLIRSGLESYKKGKIATLKLLKLGAY